MGAPEALKELEVEGSALKQDMEAKYDKYFESELKPIYQKCFDRHDKDKNGTIEQAEAEVLFTNFANLMAGTFGGTMAAFAPMMAEQLSAPEDKVKEQIEPTMQA